MARGRAWYWLGWSVLAAFVVLALLSPVIQPYDPRLPVARPLLGASRAHPLGTSALGQDLLSQLLAGARDTLVVALGVVALSTLLSWLVGLAAGLRWRGAPPLLALTDLLLALPPIPLYLLVVTLAGPGRRTLILTLGLLSWPAFARLVRALVIETRAAPYIEAATALGAGRLYLARRHILPATLEILPTKLVLTLRFAVFTEATLAFLGLAGSGSLSWGAMLSRAFDDPLLWSRPVWPWLVLPPALAIAALLVAVNWVSVGPPRRRARAGHRQSTFGAPVVVPER